MQSTEIRAILSEPVSAELVEAVARSWFENRRIGFSRGWAGAPNDVQIEFRANTLCALTALRDVLDLRA